MKRKYDKPAMRVVLLQHRTTLLAGSVIEPGNPNEPPASRRGGWDDEDDWDE